MALMLTAFTRPAKASTPRRELSTAGLCDHHSPAHPGDFEWNNSKPIKPHLNLKNTE